MDMPLLATTTLTTTATDPHKIETRNGTLNHSYSRTLAEQGRTPKPQRRKTPNKIPQRKTLSRHLRGSHDHPVAVMISGLLGLEFSLGLWGIRVVGAFCLGISTISLAPLSGDDGVRLKVLIPF